ncbi:hypothetical protein [Streptomyces sp. NPDC003077]|uniref:hypothetical protein n=1 Tax=Streptomyces sp. NPDC003077 TaxID=3154443 RepID=UPI0033A6431E
MFDFSARRLRPALAAAGVGLALTLTACGSTDSAASKAHPSASASSASSTDRQGGTPAPKATHTAHEDATEAPRRSTPAADPTTAAAPEPEPAAPEPATTHDSPGRHDGSNYDHLSPEGQRAHDTLNCAKGPGKKKGSCNEPHRKCRESGAEAVSSAGIHLTCRTAPWDGRLRWLGDEE